MNKAILIGRVGKDPEIKTTQTGKKVASFSLATGKKINGVDVTQWHNLIFWEKLAEIVEKYIKKGAQIMVEGEINYRSYDKDGQTRYITEIVCNQMEMLGSNQTNSQPQSQEQSYKQEPNDPILPKQEQDDLPF